MSAGTMTEPAATAAQASDASAPTAAAASTPARASKPIASASTNASAATTMRSSRRSARDVNAANQPGSSSPTPAAAAAAAPAPQPHLRRRRRSKKPATPVVWPAHSLGAYTPPVSRGVLKRKSAATPSLHTPFAMPAINLARSHIKELQSFTGAPAPATSAAPVVAASPTGSPAAKSARKSPAKSAEESKQAMEDTVVAEHAATAPNAAHDTTQQKEQKQPQQPPSSPPAVGSKPAGQLSLSDLLHASASSSHAPASDASVSSWLARKAAAQEKARRRAEKAAAAEKAEKAAKAKESAAALERWRAKQAEMHAQREAALAKQKADEAKVQADKDTLKRARKAAGDKAFKTFLARAAARSAEASARQHLTTAQTAQAARDKKRLAKQRFDEWVARKSDWFVGRVQSIRDKQAAREAHAAEQASGAVAPLDDDDPAEEAALDWQWLEREVEQELEAASRAKHRPPPPLPALKPASASKPRRSAAGAAERDAALARDQALLDGVMDSVDIELWNKLMAGIECTRDELDRLRENAAITTGSQQRKLMVGDGAPEIDDAVGVRRAFPTPLRSLHAPEARAMMERDLYGEREDATAADASAHAAPVVNVPLHASGYETVQLSQSAAHLYAQRQTALEAAAASRAVASAEEASAADAAASRPRSSPYPTDAASVAREAQLRPGQFAGSYAALAQAKGMDDDNENAAPTDAVWLDRGSRSSSPLGSAPRSLPPAVVRSYEAWLRGELSLAMSVPPPPRMSPARYGTVAADPDRRDDVNLMHAGTRTDDIIRAQNEQQWPIATAIKDSKQRSVNTPSAPR